MNAAPIRVLRFHQVIDIDLVIHGGLAGQLVGRIDLPRHGAPQTEASMLALAAVLKAKGMLVLPTCPDADTQGYCPGHASLLRRNNFAS